MLSNNRKAFLFQLRPLCQYILDLTLHDSKCISLLSSLKTTACITLARSVILNTGCWGCDDEEEEEEKENALTPELRFYSGYSWMDLHPWLIRFAKLLHRAETSNLQVPPPFIYPLYIVN